MRDLVAVPRYAALDHEPGELPSRPGGLFRRNHVAAGEFLVELAGPTQPSFGRVGRLVDVVAVKGKARLQAKGVARSEADRLDSGLASGRQKSVPHLGRIGVGHEHLEAA